MKDEKLCLFVKHHIDFMTPDTTPNGLSSCLAYA